MYLISGIYFIRPSKTPTNQSHAKEFGKIPDGRKVQLRWCLEIIRKRKTNCYDCFILWEEFRSVYVVWVNSLPVS